MKTRRNSTQSLIEKARQVLHSLSRDEISYIAAALQTTCENERRNILSKLSNIALFKFVVVSKIWNGTC